MLGINRLIGRLIRIGQKEDRVKVIIIKASIKHGTKKYEYEQKKWNRIEFKRTHTIFIHYLPTVRIFNVIMENGIHIILTDLIHCVYVYF